VVKMNALKQAEPSLGEPARTMRCRPLTALREHFKVQNSTGHFHISKNIHVFLRVCTRSISVAAILACLAHTLHAQGDDRNGVLGKKLRDQFVLTRTTADRSDIVAPGSIVVLQKTGLQMCSTASLAPLPNTYKNEKISVSFGDRMVWGMVAAPAGTRINDIPLRTFVPGEKFWITGYAPVKDGIFLHFYSDPYDNLRYYAQLKIPYPKGSSPSADEVMKMIAEAVTVDISAQNTQQEAATPIHAPPPSQPTEPALGPIAPPPPPPDAPPPAPPTIAIGQTRDQVVAILGQPTKMAKGPNKEIYFYPDMKVILVNGKVTDIQ
jgi:hypothetical protein